MELNYKFIGITLLIIAILLISISLGVFAYVFHHGQLSSNLSDWGAFGSYIGGVIGGAITPLALVGAVMALFQQHNSSLKEKNEFLASGILNTIERIEDSIDNELKERAYKINYTDIEYSIDSNAYNILTNALALKTEEAIPIFHNTPEEFTENIINNSTSEKEKLVLIDSYGLFSGTVGKLKFMRQLIEKHKELTGNNFVAVFYKKKYKDAVSRLIQRGYPIDTWDNLDEINNS